MKISFLLHNLRISTEGVTDYTLILVKQLLRVGKSCQIIVLGGATQEQIDKTRDFLNDQSKTVSIVAPCNENIFINHLEAVSASVRAFAPDWICVQFVYHCFRQKKGDSLDYLSSFLKAQKKYGCKIMVFIHEIWTEFKASTTFKSFLADQFKRYIFIRFFQASDPEITLVSNTAYLNALKSIGVKSSILPVFSNIIIAERDQTAVFEEIRKVAGGNFLQDRSTYWIVGMFSKIVHHYTESWHTEPLFSRMLTLAQKQGKKILLVWIGYPGGPEHTANWVRVANSYQESDPILFVQLGKRSDQFISQFFQECDFGYTTTPFSLMTKSTTIATMLEHGLTVLFNEDPPMQDLHSTLMDLYSEKQIAFGFCEGIQNLPKAFVAEPLVTKISQQFLQYLSNN